DAHAQLVAPPQQKPIAALLPFAEGNAIACARTAFRRARTSLGSRAETAARAASRPAYASVPPPDGPLPESRSGASAMTPALASSSAIARIQSVNPKIS